MKDSGVLVIRYAKALFLAASARNLTEVVSQDLDKIRDSLDSLNSGSKLLLGALIPYKIKLALWEKLLSKLTLNEITINFVYLLIKNNRVRFFTKIQDNLDNMQRSANGITLAEIISAVDLDKTLEEQISTTLSDLLKTNIKMSVKRKEDILGGLILKIDSKMIDTSIESKLKKIANNMNNIRVSEDYG